MSVLALVRAMDPSIHATGAGDGKIEVDGPCFRRATQRLHRRICQFCSFRVVEGCLMKSPPKFRWLLGRSGREIRRSSAAIVLVFSCCQLQVVFCDYALWSGIYSAHNLIRNPAQVPFRWDGRHAWSEGCCRHGDLLQSTGRLRCDKLAMTANPPQGTVLRNGVRRRDLLRGRAPGGILQRRSLPSAAL